MKGFFVLSRDAKSEYLKHEIRYQGLATTRAWSPEDLQRHGATFMRILAIEDEEGTCQSVDDAAKVREALQLAFVDDAFEIVYGADEGESDDHLQRMASGRLLGYDVCTAPPTYSAAAEFLDLVGDVGIQLNDRGLFIDEDSAKQFLEKVRGPAEEEYGFMYVWRVWDVDG